MFGDNPIRPPIIGQSDIFQVQSIFTTFQGEGPFVGESAVFLRLGGCNLACKFCDTEFESFQDIHQEEIIEQVNLLAACKRKLVVITGGEPLRQPIEQLCERLIERGFKVQLETNGTLFRQLHPDVHIICSPKNTGIGYKRLREDLLARITALKFLVSANLADYYDINDVGQSDYDIPVYIQPMDEYNEQLNHSNMRRALEIAEERGYRISLQMHKYLNIE